MNPAVITAALAKLLPWLGRLSGPALTSVLTKLAASGGPVLRTGREAVAWVSKDPVKNGLTVLSVLATLGTLATAIGDKFSARPEMDDRADPVVVTIDKLITLDSANRARLRAREETIGAEDSSLNLKIAENRDDNAIMADVLDFGLNMFGSKREMIEGHRRLRVFLEVQHDDLVAAAGTLIPRKL